MPSCGKINCTDCKIIWREGKRFVVCENGDEVSPEAFIVAAVTALIKDVAYIKARLDDRSGLVP